MAETEPEKWCFFLYDSSRVASESDATRDGILHFHPTKTPQDHQELLCGQIAGTARCVAEISGTAPETIRLRRRKFALKKDGDYLWVLGGDADAVSDAGAGLLLEELIGLFRFYHGSVRRAYAERGKEDLREDWERYAAHVFRGDVLRRTFNAVPALDRNRVEPLLLLKAALVLQSCQRVLRVVAGCVLYQGLVVSTQLPPGITAKVSLDADADPAGVRVLRVFLSEDEAAALREFPVEGPRGRCGERGEGDPVEMSLYLHRVGGGLSLRLLAQEAFDRQQEVFQGSLASLNGLQVHLQETLLLQGSDPRPLTPHDPRAATYAFLRLQTLQGTTHTNFPPDAGRDGHPFVRAVSLLHATFGRTPAASEMTVRSGSTAVYGCRGSVHETYFQNLGSPQRNSGAPNPRDGAFALPGKAKQKLLKHGFNLL